MTPHTGPGGPGDLVRRHLAAIAAIGERPTGSEPNRHLEAYLGGVLRDAGCGVERLAFSCEDWRAERVFLRCGEDGLVGVANPYSLPCDVEAEGRAALFGGRGLTNPRWGREDRRLHPSRSLDAGGVPFFSGRGSGARRRLRAWVLPPSSVSPRLDFPVPASS